MSIFGTTRLLLSSYAMYIHYYVPTTADTLQMWQIENSISFFFLLSFFKEREEEEDFFFRMQFFLYMDL